MYTLHALETWGKYETQTHSGLSINFLDIALLVTCSWQLVYLKWVNWFEKDNIHLWSQYWMQKWNCFICINLQFRISPIWMNLYKTYFFLFYICFLSCIVHIYSMFIYFLIYTIDLEPAIKIFFWIKSLMIWLKSSTSICFLYLLYFFLNNNLDQG